MLPCPSMSEKVKARLLQEYNYSEDDNSNRSHTHNACFHVHSVLAKASKDDSEGWPVSCQPLHDLCVFNELLFVCIHSDTKQTSPSFKLRSISFVSRSSYFA